VAEQIIAPNTVHPTKGYSHAIRSGDLVFVSGQVSQDKAGAVVGVGDAAAQADQVFKNLKAVLEAAGSGLDLILKTTVLTTKLEYRPAITEAREKYFGPLSRFPASTFMVVSSLALPEWLIEIEAVATVRK